MKCKQFVRVYSRAAAIMPFEVKDWEKMFWYLRFLIPLLIVPKAGAGDLRDLLDSVDLNTYGLRRTALNVTIGLDAGDATLDPNKPVMVNAGGDEEDPKSPLDRILEEFNERWFKGWEASPEEQKAKMILHAQAVVKDEDYQDLVVGNSDQQAVEDIMARLIDKAMRSTRKGDNSLYKNYQMNEAFRADYRNAIRRLVENLEYII